MIIETLINNGYQVNYQDEKLVVTLKSEDMDCRLETTLNIDFPLRQKLRDNGYGEKESDNKAATLWTNSATNRNFNFLDSCFEEWSDGISASYKWSDDTGSIKGYASYDYAIGVVTAAYGISSSEETTFIEQMNYIKQ